MMIDWGNARRLGGMLPSRTKERLRIAEDNGEFACSKCEGLLNV